MAKSKKMKKIFAKIDDSYGIKDLICGHCGSVLYGFDEEICPCCGQLNDFSKIPGDIFLRK